MYSRKNTKFALYNKFESIEDYVKMLEAAIDLTIIGFVITDGKGNIIRINSAYKKVSGYEPEAMLGKNLRDIDKIDETPSATMRVINSKKPLIEEMHHSNGRSFMNYAVPYFNTAGDIEYVISTLIDTTDINITKTELARNKYTNEQLNSRIKELEEQLKNNSKIVYKSRIMKNLIETCNKISRYDSTVLISGESGVGKEVVANYIHENSDRAICPYIKINCASIPDALIESEFFGYEAGAFTGASIKGKIGLVELANGGTLLLDEVTEMPLALQSKFLRFLQEGEFYRVGGKEVIKTNVRIIAASNRNLEQMVQDGLFREDLYYRLNVIPLRIPSLKERVEDIPLLIHYFLKQFNDKYNTKKSINNDVINIMVQKNYKGNIRELSNQVERLLLLSEDEVVLEDIFKIFDFSNDLMYAPSDTSLKSMVENYEKDILKKYISIYKTTSQTAKILKTDQSTISRKLKKYNIPH